MKDELVELACSVKDRKVQYDRAMEVQAPPEVHVAATDQEQQHEMSTETVNVTALVPASRDDLLRYERHLIDGYEDEVRLQLDKLYDVCFFRMLLLHYDASYRHIDINIDIISNLFGDSFLPSIFANKYAVAD